MDCENKHTNGELHKRVFILWLLLRKRFMGLHLKECFCLRYYFEKQTMLQNCLGICYYRALLFNYYRL